MPVASRIAATIAAAFALFSSLSASAEEPLLRLSYDDVRSRARSANADVSLARLAVEETRGELIGARSLLLRDVDVSLAGGPRFSDSGPGPAADAGLGIPLEVFGQRGLRIERAERAVSRDLALADDVERQIVARALTTYLVALHAEATMQLAEQRAEIAAELLRIVEERRRVGEAGDFDVGIIRIEAARARRGAIVAAAEHTAALGQLRSVLQIHPDQPIVLAGPLPDAAREAVADLERDLPSHMERPDLRAAAFAVESAAAEVTLAERNMLPVPSLNLGYELEGDEHSTLAGVSIPIPLFTWNQGAIAEARARLARLEAAERFMRRQAVIELTSAERRAALVGEALQVLESEAVPEIDQTVEMACRAYGAGERDLTELLIVIRGAIEARQEHLDALLSVGSAAVAVDEARGGAMQESSTRAEVRAP